MDTHRGCGHWNLAAEAGSCDGREGEDGSRSSIGTCRTSCCLLPPAEIEHLALHGELSQNLPSLLLIPHPLRVSPALGSQLLVAPDQTTLSLVHIDHASWNAHS